MSHFKEREPLSSFFLLFSKKNCFPYGVRTRKIVCFFPLHRLSAEYIYAPLGWSLAYRFSSISTFIYTIAALWNEEGRKKLKRRMEGTEHWARDHSGKNPFHGRICDVNGLYILFCIPNGTMLVCVCYPAVRLTCYSAMEPGHALSLFIPCRDPLGHQHDRTVLSRRGSSVMGVNHAERNCKQTEENWNDCFFTHNYWA